MKLSIKKEVTREVEINPPMFWKDTDSPNQKYVAYIDKDTVVRVFTSKNFTSIQNGSPLMLNHELSEAYFDYNLCDESEFLRVYSEALEAIRLHPKEHTVNNCMDHEAHNNLKQQISY